MIQTNEKPLLKEKNDLMHYATQDGTELDDDYVERIFNKIENIFDNLEDLIENELDDDSNQNLGITFKF